MVVMFCHHRPNSHFLAWVIKVLAAIAVQTHVEVLEVNTCVVTSGSLQWVAQVICQGESGKSRVPQVQVFRLSRGLLCQIRPGQISTLSLLNNAS